MNQPMHQTFEARSFSQQEAESYRAMALTDAEVAALLALTSAGE